MSHTKAPLTPVLEITHLISLFHFKASPGFSFAGETHDFWEFVYIDQGQILITAGEKEYILKAGELAFHKPGEFHAISAYNDTPSCYIVSAFVSESPCMDYFIHRFTSLSTKEREYLYEALRGRFSVPGIYSQYGVKNPQTDQLNDHVLQSIQTVRANLELLLLKLLERAESRHIQQRIESYMQITIAQQTTARIKEYLQMHVSENLTLDEISRNLGYSISQMKKLFRRDAEQSIMDYFIGLKINEAKRMLQEGNLNTSQIAEKLGYTSLSYFCRQFKQREGMTSMEYCKSFE